MASDVMSCFPLLLLLSELLNRRNETHTHTSGRLSPVGLQRNADDVNLSSKFSSQRRVQLYSTQIISFSCVFFSPPRNQTNKWWSESKFEQMGLSSSKQRRGTLLHVNISACSFFFFLFLLSLLFFSSPRGVGARHETQMKR